MREIKFRGKTKRGDGTYGWIYGNYIQSSHEIVECLTDKSEQYFSRVIPETVGQFTGIHDKNGKKIYEGDIFNMGDKNIKYVVEWIDCGLKGRQLNNKSYVGLQYWNKKIEIIGNVFDNPELLKNK